MLQTKYLVAVVAIMLAVTNALQTAIVGGIEPAEVVQLGIVLVSAVTAIWVPLVQGRWAGLFKTGLAIVFALLTALAPFVITGTIAPEQWVTVILAGLTALGIQLGVTVRTDAVKAAADVLDPFTPVPGTGGIVQPVDLESRAAQNAIATLTADPAAAEVVLKQAA